MLTWTSQFRSESDMTSLLSQKQRKLPNQKRRSLYSASVWLHFSQSASLNSAELAVSSTCWHSTSSVLLKSCSYDEKLFLVKWKFEPTSSLTGQRGDLPADSSTSSRSEDDDFLRSVTRSRSSDGTMWCCSLQQWVRTLPVFFCVSSFVVLSSSFHHRNSSWI